MTDQPQIFLSYAHTDRQFVDNIDGRLRSAGYSTWIDHRDIYPGEEWLPAIIRAIKKSTFFLACISSDSIDRRGILQKEIRRALDQLELQLTGDVFLIPAWIGRGDIPKEIPETLDKYQWVALSKPDGMPKLLRSLKRQLNRLGLPGVRASGGGGPEIQSNAPSHFPSTPFVDKLRDFSEQEDRDAVSDSVEELTAFLEWTDEVFPKRDSVRALHYLRQKNWVELRGQLAEALLLAKQQAPEVRRHYAEFMIERGELYAALQILELLQTETANDPTENANVQALYGRALQQQYIQADEKSGQRIRGCLAGAVGAFLDVYKSDRKRHVIHGARAAALLCRSKREQSELDGHTDPKALGLEILYAIDDKNELEGHLSLRECCAAVEACLAAEKKNDAIKWSKRSADHTAEDSAELRQLHANLLDVWELDAELPDPLLLPLQHKLNLSAATDGADVRTNGQLSVVDPETGAFERVLGEDRYKTFAWYRRGLLRAHSVARIEDNEGNPIGTGFLVRGGDLVGSLGDECLLLTSAVVFTTDELSSELPFQSLAFKDASVSFTASDLSNPHKYAVKEVLWSSPPYELDATLARLDRPIDEIEPIAIARRLPLANGEERVVVLGHPKGGQLSFSLSDNLLLDHDSTKVHYRAPTSPGSAGSPVFNSVWEVIAVHHAGGTNMPRLHDRTGTYAANEGISVRAIAEAMKAEFLSG